MKRWMWVFGRTRLYEYFAFQQAMDLRQSHAGERVSSLACIRARAIQSRVAPITTRALLYGLCLAPCAPLACGGRSQNQPAATAGTGGATSAAGGSAQGGTAQPGSTSGAAGTLTIIDDTCDRRAASEAACRAKIGETFVDFKLGAHQGRYTHGCDPQCGDREGPESSADFEKGSNSYITACEVGPMVTLTFEHDTGPSEIGFYLDRDSPAGTTYTLSGWAVQPFAAGSNVFVGTAQAVNVVDASDAGTLELSYSVCP